MLLLESLPLAFYISRFQVAKENLERTRGGGQRAKPAETGGGSPREGGKGDMKRKGVKLRAQARSLADQEWNSPVW